MGKFNGAFRDREIEFRGLKKMNTSLIGGFRTCYNYTKKHIDLKGKIPAEASKIKVEGSNKWQTLIQNASLHTWK